MTRFSYFLFTALLVGLVYTILFFVDPKHATLNSTLTYFSGPLIFANFAMAIYSLLAWAITHDDDVSKGGVTFLNATWITALATYIAYKLILAGGIFKLFSSFT